MALVEPHCMPLANLASANAPAGLFDQFASVCSHDGVQMYPMEVHSTQPVNFPCAEGGPDCHAQVAFLQGCIWRLSTDGQGCRLVQEVLTDAACDDERIVVASELHTHVWEALRCPNANHVLQKCIDTMRPADSQFIIDEILEGGPGAILR